MDNETATPPPRVRPHDVVVGAMVAAVYAVIWWFLPAEWSPSHTGGKWFLFIFVITSGLAALLASVFLTNWPPRTKDHPAIWLGVQVVFWNPLAFRAVLAAVEALGLPSAYGGAIALGGVVLLGLPTSLIGAGLCGSRLWAVTYLARGLQSFVASWVPLFPPVLFLHVVLLAECINWQRHGTLHRCAVALVLAEQVAAFLWAFLFSQIQG